MVVPDGEHEIKFVFKPSSYYSGNKVSLASSILLILLIAGYFASGSSKRQRRERMVIHSNCPLCSSAITAFHLKCTDHLVSRKEFELYGARNVDLFSPRAIRMRRK